MHHTAGDKQSPYFIHDDALFTPGIAKTFSSQQISNNTLTLALPFFSCAASGAEQENKLPWQRAPDTFNIN
jgi:hypothetical protein